MNHVANISHSNSLFLIDSYLDTDACMGFLECKKGEHNNRYTYKYGHHIKHAGRQAITPTISIIQLTYLYALVAMSS